MARRRALQLLASCCTYRYSTSAFTPAAGVPALPPAVAQAAERFSKSFTSSAGPWLSRRVEAEQTSQQRTYSDTGQAEQAASPGKRHALKCTTTAAGSPVSQAVACMVDRDVQPRQQLCSRMDQLSQQLVNEAAPYSSTELSAFVEACRKMDYQHRQAFRTIMQRLAPTAASIAADELPSLLWAASTLATEQQGAKPQQTTTPSSSSSSSSSSHSSSSSSHSSSSGGGKFVPQNDGVIGAVNSSRIADLPEVVEFMLGASQVLSGDMEEVDTQELPIIAAALTDLEYRDPFLLTVLAESVIERKSELSGGELVALVHSFAAMGRWFFDNRLIDQLTVVLVERARAGKVQQESVDSIASCLLGIRHKNKVLQQYLEERQHA